MAIRPTEDFRAEAVRITLTSGMQRKQEAADFGVGFSTHNRWIRRNRRDPEKPTTQSDLEGEIAELQKESRMLWEERNVLKKSSLCSLRSEANDDAARQAVAKQTP